MNIFIPGNNRPQLPGQNSRRIENARVEEVSTEGGQTGSLLVSYRAQGQGPATAAQQLRVNVGRGTRIQSQSGLPLPLRSIMPGMWIDADISPAMAASMPPQASASRIVVRQWLPLPTPPIPPLPQPQPPANVVTQDRIVSIDPNDSSLLTGNPYDINEQIQYNLSDETLILNRNGGRISLRALRPGQMVQITHANFQTASIPPQTPAYRIQVI